MKRIAIVFFLGCVGIVQAVAPNSLSTTFVDVSVSPVPLGETVTLQDVAGRDFLVMNGSAKPLRVEITAELPREGEKRSYAKVIPDLSWITIDPVVLELPANSHRSARITLHVPNERRYRGQTYQVMLRATRLTDPAEKSLQIVQALRVRVIFVIQGK